MAKKASSKVVAAELVPVADTAATATLQPSEGFHVHDLGAVHDAAIPFLPGQIVCLYGDNGAGKSTTTAAIKAIANGEPLAVKRRDGTEAGVIEGLGVTVVIRTKTQVDGRIDPEVKIVDNDEAINEFWSGGGLKGDKEKDARRIKAIAKIGKITASRPEFQKGLDLSDNDAKLAFVSAPDSDIVEFVAKVKKNLQEMARDAEKNRDTASGEMQALAGVLDCMTEVKSDEELTAALNAAMIAKGAADARAETARKLAEARKESHQPSAELQQTLADIETAIAEANGRKAEIEKEISSLQTLKTQAGEQLTAAKDFEAMQASVTAGGISVEDAQAAVDAATKAISDNGVAKNARDNREKARDAQKRVTENEERAAKLRGAADKADAVLQDVIKRVRKDVEIVNGRLYTVSHPVRGKCLVDELSDGERVNMALEMQFAASPVDKCVASIPQNLWEALDDKNRNSVREMIAKTRVCMYVASCRRGGAVHAEAYTGAPEAV
jgi:predicted ATP-binding protein involved in virulence